VQLARAMAQLDLEDDAARPILLLDEPTANLDLAHQHAVLRLAREITHRGVAVVAILHDLGLAFAYGDLVLVMHEGRAVAHGRPQDVLTPDLMRRVFMVEGMIVSGHLVVQGPLAT
jgi:iron complex transport system ATP-binding protein